MIIEKSGSQRLTVIITKDDLSAREITRDDLDSNFQVIKTLIDDVAVQAYEELGFKFNESVLTISFTSDEDDVDGSITMDLDFSEWDKELESLNTLLGEGLIPLDILKEVGIVASSSESALGRKYSDMQTVYSEDGGDVLSSLIFKFNDIENVIQLAHCLGSRFDEETRLFHFNRNYYLSVDGLITNDDSHDDIYAILSEYGDVSKFTLTRIEEYGKVIYSTRAVQGLIKSFQLEAGAIHA